MVDNKWNVSMIKETFLLEEADAILDISLPRNYNYFGVLVHIYIFGVLVHDIFVLSRNCTVVSFSHVKRSGNAVAHKLAKMSEGFGEMRVWLEESPQEVCDFVMADCSPD